MALVTCSECGNRISDQAEKCPFCGKPQGERTVTLQFTSKKWKLVKLIAVVLIIVTGLFFLNYFNKYGMKDSATDFWFMAMFFSFILLFVGRLGAWWANK